MKEQKIYLVWNPAGRSPSYIHPSHESAKNEAKRLARLHPDNKFYVLESVGVALKQEVAYYVHSDKPEPFDDGIPF